MSITIKDALQLEPLTKLTLLTDKSGLNRKISTVGILDHEILEDGYQVFQDGEFILTTLSVIKSNPEFLEDVIKRVIALGASALAIKNIYYTNLPDELINMANDNHFSIFIFDDSVYFENIIATLMFGMKSNSLYEQYEEKLEMLFKGMVNAHTVEQIAMELNPLFLNHHQVIYCRENRFLNERNVLATLDRYSRSDNKFVNHSVFKFRKGLMIVLSSKDSTNRFDLDFNFIFNTLGLEFGDYAIGKSSLREHLNSLNIAINEAYFAFETCQIENLHAQEYDDIGIYRLLLPLAGSPWLKTYYETILNPILAFDQSNNKSLFNTALTFVDNGGHIQSTAQALFQHKNTIHYRLNKIKSITGPFKNDNDFYQQLSVAVKAYKIQKYR